jgi:hypothetical protein
MQKVSKEYVDDYLKKVVSPPKCEEDVAKIFKRKSVFKTDILLNLIKLREAELLKELAEKTKNAKKNIYELWNLQEASLIQDLAECYGERICLEESIKKLAGKKYYNCLIL